MAMNLIGDSIWYTTSHLHLQFVHTLMIYYFFAAIGCEHINDWHEKSSGLLDVLSY
jgi:hypothetical protein